MVASLSIRASALGGFVAIKGENIYHDFMCDLVAGHYLEDLEWFDSVAQAERAGYKPCEACDAANGSDFTRDGDIWFLSEDNKITCALEFERIRGILAGFDAGKESAAEEVYDSAYGIGYDKGYDDGHSSGKEDGYDSGYNVGYSEGAESAKPDWTILAILAVACSFAAYYYGKQKSQADLASAGAALSKGREALHMLNVIAKGVGKTPEDLLDALYVNLLVKNGYTEADAQALLKQRKQEHNF
jgi:hypothetical protein